jgi:hypothetical protein
MGKVFGIISLVCALVSFGLTPLSYFAIPVGARIMYTFGVPTIAITGIVMGIVGCIKDDSKGLAIAGLVIAPLGLINFFIGTVLSFLGLTY